MSLSSWFRRTPGPPVLVTLYTRPGCGLCEELKEELARAGLEGRYRLEEVDVSRDPELEERYGRSIPVLSIAGRPAFKGRATAAEIRERFERRVRETAEGGS